MSSGFAAAAEDWSARIVKMSRAVQAGRRETLMRAGKIGKAEHEKVIRRDSGGDMRLSGVNAAKGRGGNTKVGARFDINADNVEFKATGPLQIIAHDTSAHGIASAYIRSARTHRSNYAVVSPDRLRHTARTVINIPGVGYRRWARHPGTKGKDTWRRGAVLARPKVSKEIHEVHTNIIRKALS